MKTFIGAFLCLLIPGIVSAQVAAHQIWQIGEWNQSPVEFSDHARGAPLDYQVGKSNWKTDWPGAQEVKQPFKITFSLESVRGTYTLKIGTLIDRPLVPALQVDVNGHAGLFFLHPKLSYSRS